MSRKQLRFILISSLITISGLAQSAIAEDSGSLDSMWIDQDAPAIGNDAGSKQKGPVASLHAGGVLSTVAPMCSLETFKTSGFVSKVFWPGIGPFKASETTASEFIDDGQNHLKLGLSGDQVASAELGLGKLGNGNARDFLDIQMSADFLLEALGAKPRKIADFNIQLEKNKEAIRKNKAISLAAGRYQVTIDRSANAQPYSCLIAVNSLDASKSILKEHSDDNSGETPTTAKAETPIKKLIPDLIKKTAQNIKNTTASVTAAPKQAISPSLDPKRDQFVSTIKSWQQVKKAALKNRDTTHLADILSGNALAKQSTAVKWLQTHQKYYDMEPRGAAVDKYTDLGGGKKYSVVAQVREFSKYIDDTTSQVLKEVDDKYTVNYTIEKIGDKWMIVDSSVLSNGQTPAVKPLATKR